MGDRLRHDVYGEVLPDSGRLKLGRDKEGEKAAWGSFSGLRSSEQYELVVDEDPSLADAPRKTYVASGTMAGRVISGDVEGSAMGEDASSCSCIFGNPCASAYNCSDWANRFQKAKQNGWKGF